MHPLLLIAATLALAGCGLLGTAPPAAPVTASGKPADGTAAADPRANDVVMFALGLVDTGYRFGGKNPEAGLDCSGMVSYVFDKAAGVRLAGSAADIAREGRPVNGEGLRNGDGLHKRDGLRPGDLVFFNTRNQPRSHVGIYIGDDRFVHAPSSNGRVRIESLSRSWFATRFEEGRTYFD